MMDKTRGTRTTRSGAKRALDEERKTGRSKSSKKENATVPIITKSPTILQAKNNEKNKVHGKTNNLSNPPGTKKPVVVNLMNLTDARETIPVKLGAPVFSQPAIANIQVGQQKTTFVKREQMENMVEPDPSNQVEESPKQYEELRKMQIYEEDAWINEKLALFENSENISNSDESGDSDAIDLSPKRPRTSNSPDLSVCAEHSFPQVSLAAHSEFEDTSSPQKTGDNSERLDLTTNHKWNPISFAKKCLFDMKHGVVLSRAECDESSKMLTRNNREVDYYPYLELAQKFHNKDTDLQNICFGLAFSTMMQNKTTQKLRKTGIVTGNTEIPVIDGNGFSLDQAIRNEDLIKLPSGFSFRMSSLITSHQASKWTSSKFQESSKSLLRAAFKKLASHDYYFAAYSPTEYSTSGYYPVGEQFYKSVSKFIYCGFKQEFSLEMESKCCCMAREVLTYLQDRFRKEYNIYSKMSVNELTENLTAHLKREGGNIKYFELDFKKEPVHQNFKSLKIGN